MRNSTHSNMSKRYEQPESDQDNSSAHSSHSNEETGLQYKKEIWKNFQPNDNMSLKVKGLSPIPYNHNTSNSSNNSYFLSPENCKRITA